MASVNHLSIRNYATLFDVNYLSRGLSLLESLKEHSLIPFKLYVLCLDKKVEEYFAKNSHTEVVTLTLTDLELWRPTLLKAKDNRSIVEYYFTLSPALPLFLLETNPDIEFITTLDSDILFFNDPALIFNDFGNYSILITPHKFTERLKHHEVHGLYNVSFQSFKNNKVGNECLNWWFDKCIDWCYDVVEVDRFADQKYLDEFCSRYPGEIKILNEKGAGLAPWNINQYSISKKNGILYIDNELLVFYHYHHFRKHSKYLYNFGLAECFVNSTPIKSIKNIYTPYIRIINKYGKETTDSNVTRLQNKKGNSMSVFLLNTRSIFFYANEFVSFSFSIWKISFYFKHYFSKIKNG